MTGTAQEPREYLAALVPGIAPQGNAIYFEHVERIEERIACPQAPDRSAQPVEVGHAIGAAHHTLAVERHRFYAQRRDCLHDQRHPVCPIAAVPAEHAHAVRLAVADKAETVV